MVGLRGNQTKYEMMRTEINIQPSCLTGCMIIGQCTYVSILNEPFLLYLFRRINVKNNIPEADPCKYILYFGTDIHAETFKYTKTVGTAVQVHSSVIYRKCNVHATKP